MNDKVKALLRRIVFQLRDSIEGDEFALEDLSDGLASSDVTPEELAAAFDAILSLTESSREELPEPETGSRVGNRVLSLEERSRLTPEAYGYLLGVHRTDFERVNGYDMRFEGWGEEDVDIAVRLRRIGLRCGHAGPDGTLIHLAHESDVPIERPNWYLLQATEQSDRIEAVDGLRELVRAGV